jgi:hypothetical protein
MYLILEKGEHGTYAYVENNQQFKKMAHYRESMQELPQKTLNDECDLRDLPINSYIIFGIAPRTTKKKKTRAK